MNPITDSAKNQDPDVLQSNMFGLFTEIYWSRNEVILEQYLLESVIQRV